MNYRYIAKYLEKMFLTKNGEYRPFILRRLQKIYGERKLKVSHDTTEYPVEVNRVKFREILEEND